MPPAVSFWRPVPSARKTAIAETEKSSQAEIMKSSVRAVVAATLSLSLSTSCATLGLDYGAVFNGEREINEAETAVGAGALLLLLTPFIALGWWLSQPVISEGDTDEPQKRIDALAEGERDCDHEASIVLEYRTLPVSKQATNDGDSPVVRTTYGDTVRSVYRRCLSEAENAAERPVRELPYIKDAAQVARMMPALGDTKLKEQQPGLAKAVNAMKRADEVGALLGDKRAEDDEDVLGKNTFQEEQAQIAAYAAMVDTELTRRRTDAEKRVRDNLKDNAELLAKSASWEKTMPALAFTACTLISPTYMSAWNTPEEKTAVEEAHAKGRACVKRLVPALKKAASLPLVLDVSALPQAERTTVLDRAKSVVPPSVTWTTDAKATKLTVRHDDAAIVTPPQTEQTTVSHTWVTGSRTVDNPEFRTLQAFVTKQQGCLARLSPSVFASTPGCSGACGSSSADRDRHQREAGCAYNCSSYDCSRRGNLDRLNQANAKLAKTSMTMSVDDTRTVSRPAQETKMTASWSWSVDVAFADGRPRRTLTGTARGTVSSTKHAADPAVELRARDDGPINVEKLKQLVLQDALGEIVAAVRQAVDLDAAGLEQRGAVAKSKEEKADALLRKELMSDGAVPVAALQAVFGATVVPNGWTDTDAQAAIKGKH